MNRTFFGGILFRVPFYYRVPFYFGRDLYNHYFSLVVSDDSPTTWDHKEHRLKILSMEIINKGVATKQYNHCVIKFTLEVTY